MSDTKDKFEISSEVSSRICGHMNDDHAVTVHAMVRSVAGWNMEISNVKLLSVHPSHYTISYVVCNGEMCSMERSDVILDPPILTKSNIRPRLVSEHHRVLAPSFRGCMLDHRVIFTFAIGIIIVLLHLNELLRDNVFELVVLPLGIMNKELFQTVIKNTYWLLIILHEIESLYAMYLCKVKLGMNYFPTFQWCFLVLISGVPTTKKLIELACCKKAKKSMKNQ